MQSKSKYNVALELNNGLFCLYWCSGSRFIVDSEPIETIDIEQRGDLLEFIVSACTFELLIIFLANVLANGQTSCVDCNHLALFTSVITVFSLHCFFLVI